MKTTFGAIILIAAATANAGESANRTSCSGSLRASTAGSWRTRGSTAFAGTAFAAIFGFREGRRCMNPVIHFEMPAQDRQRMATFYEKAFDWQTRMLGPEMGEYVVVTTTETDDEDRKNRARSTGDSS